MTLLNLESESVRVFRLRHRLSVNFKDQLRQKTPAFDSAALVITAFPNQCATNTLVYICYRTSLKAEHILYENCLLCVLDI